MKVLENFDTDAARAIKGISMLDDSAFEEFLASEGLPSSMGPKEYIDYAARQVLIESTAWEMRALCKAFFSVVSLQVANNHKNWSNTRLSRCKLCVHSNSDFACGKSNLSRSEGYYLRTRDPNCLFLCERHL